VGFYPKFRLVRKQSNRGHGSRAGYTASSMDAPQIPGCTGAIIAGGRATRMGGVAKGLFRSGGVPLAARSVALFRDLFGAALVVANDPAPYVDLGAPVVADRLPDRGAPGGLHAALAAAETEWVFAAGCDMPGLAAPNIAFLAERRAGADAVLVRFRGHLEPLHAFWSRRCLPVLERLLREGEPSMRDLAAAVSTRVVEEEEWREVDPDGRAFENINTPEDATRLGLEPPPGGGPPPRGEEHTMDATRWVRENRDRHFSELVEFLRIPSISSSSAHRQDVARAAAFLEAEMRRLGLDARIFPTEGHPVVYGEWMGAGAERPTVLVYGHYDVQPVDPLPLWKSPPFDPEVRDGALYARGAVDDKGQVWVHLKAFEAWRGAGGPPVNVKMIFEGEEEVGSVHLGAFLAAERKRLAADAVVVSDSPMFSKGVPSICYGLRGLVYVQVDVEGPRVDLHSGSFGGAVLNPANALARMVAALQDPSGKVLVPGFYASVRRLGARERAQVRRLPFDAREWLRSAGSPPAPWGEPGFHVLERIWARPTLEVNGIYGGYQGEGAKTIIPSRASAKISCRLVPDQTPEEIEEKLTRHLKAITPREVKVTVTSLHGGPAFLSAVDHPAFRATERALERAFGRKPVLTREGGSIPFTATIQDALRCPVILMGFGLPDENSHAPNERLDLENYEKGILSAIYLYEELAAAPPPPPPDGRRRAERATRTSRARPSGTGRTPRPRSSRTSRSARPPPPGRRGLRRPPR
jgi:acetylornithine deacetylase/succinyl-diaminopimelate desuccinylase-like protein/molybdopterin-guanine dinucleotide biosynthesis protein A